MPDPAGLPAETRDLLALCQRLALADTPQALPDLLLAHLRQAAGVQQATLLWRDGGGWRPCGGVDAAGPAPLLPVDAQALMDAATAPAPDGGPGLAALPLCALAGAPAQGWLWFAPASAAASAAFAVLPVFAALYARARQPRAGAAPVPSGGDGVVEQLRRELRGPMNTILGMSQLALRSGLTPQQHNYVAKVERAAAGLLGLVDELLDQALLQAGALAPEAAPFDLGELMDQVVQALAPAADEKGLELLLALPDLPAGQPVGDARRLAQLLGRLGRHAVETTDRGEIALGVEMLDAAPGALRMAFTVRDTGLGLTREQRDALARAPGAGTAAAAGTSLALAQGLAVRLGGTLEAAALAEGGSLLRVALPFGLHRAALPPPPPLRAARVLVVDDHPAAREQLQQTLRTLGLHADGAADGWDALRAVALAREAGAPFDLAFIDWKMPGMDGSVCAAQLAAADPPAPRLAMLTLDGRDELVSRLASQRTAVGAVLRKAMTPAALRAACVALLGAVAPLHTPPREGLLGLHGARLRGARILVVDDNAIQRELAQELLASAGLAVSVAGDGREALRLLAEQTFDGVLMDVQMPVLDGYAATRAIREQPRLRDLPVIAMTTSAGRGDRERALAAGMNDHVAKPIVVEQLFAAITRWLRPAAPPPPAPATPAPDAPGGDRLARLPGIDARIGRASTMGNDGLYRRLLLMFLKGQRDFGRQFRAARAGGDGPGAMRMAHNLRTVSGSLGAPAVQAAARVLEDACNRAAGDAEIAPLLEAVERELAPVMDGLAALADETAANV